jgi:hypothetical protein
MIIPKPPKGATDHATTWAAYVNEMIAYSIQARGAGERI